GDEFDKYERQARKEEQFQNKLEDALVRFRRQGQQLLAEGDMVALRKVYVDSAVETAVDEEGKEFEVLRKLDDELRALIAEYDVDLDSGPYADI
ncbi:MAG: hypothetical protein ACC700_16670, partial [Anaerolineales bacterium]